LQKLAAAVAPVAGNGNIVVVASPDAATALVLRLPAAVEWPVLTSASLPVRTVIAVAANAIVSAVEGTPQVDAATSPELHMNTTPGEVVASGGVVASVYQSDKVALRLRWPISWALRDARGLAFMQNVNW
jgi:hypothetical protein